MNIKEILSKVDHTQLAPETTWQNIKDLCDDAQKYQVATVCIPASYLKQAKAYSKIKLCTVIGFPNGYSLTEIKCAEAKAAINDGAREIDMVINIGALKDQNYQLVLEEIKAVKATCADHILKVIIETCLLNDAEKIKACQIINDSGADFIKTSTGMSKGGATFEDISLFKKHINPKLGIKAAGGIASLADAEQFIKLGASRLGTSRIIKILKNQGAEGY